MKQNEILRIYGTNYKEMAQQLLETADLAGQIRAKLPQSMPRIGIKPNLVSPTPAMFGATTHPEIVAGIIEYLQEQGFQDLTICEGSWVGDKTSDAFHYCGFEDLAQQYHVRLFDTQTDTSFEVSVPEIPPLRLCSCLKDIDFLINVPVLKGHCQTRVTCALKNMKGLIPNTEKRRFHSLGLHKPIALLNTCIHQDFIVIDHICGDPDFEDGGNPLVRNCIMAALDPVLTDAYACKILGYDPLNIDYIRLAAEAGIGSADLTGLQLKTLFAPEEYAASVFSNREAVPTTHNSSQKNANPFSDYQEKVPEETAAAMTHKSLQLNYATEEIDSCSACYSSLTIALNRLHEQGYLRHLTDEQKLRFCIGQGYRRQSCEDPHCIGIGTCTRLFQKNIPGCPPTEDAIYDYLFEEL